MRAGAQLHFDWIVNRGLEQLQKDGDWLPVMTFLVDAAIYLDDKQTAELLYEMLLDYQHLHVVVGLTSIYLGPVALSLGRLAKYLGMHKVVESHLELAMEKATLMKAKPHMALIAYEVADYLMDLEPDNKPARALEQVNRSLDLAERTGMKKLVHQLIALKLKFQS